MNKLIWIILCFLTFFASCNNEDEIGRGDYEPTGSFRANHFYGVKSPEGVRMKGVAVTNKLWYNGTTIKVKLLNDPYKMKDKIVEYAREWEQYANIKFNFVDEGKAEVRIGFDFNDQRYITWSYVGTDCKYVTNQKEPTMSFAYFDSANEKEIRGDVLRAFGMALGLELEYRHLKFNPGWTSRIAEYWEGEIEDIPWEDLKEYVFDPLENENLVQTKEYDENSIMVWPFSKKYAANTARDFNYVLSESDILFIKKLYPRDNSKYMLKIEASSARQMYSIINTETIVIDWGDGNTTELLPSIKEQSVDYIYDDYEQNWQSKHTIKFYGSETAITSLSCPSNYIYDFDISGCKGLESLNFETNLTKDIDLSNNLKLKTLYLGTNYDMFSVDISMLKDLELFRSPSVTTSLNVSQNTKLKALYYSTLNGSSIDVSNCLELEALDIYCHNQKPITSIDLSKNKKLKSLSLYGCNIPSLDISNNTQLAFLWARGNNISAINISSLSYAENIFIYENPIEKDESAMLAIANALPHIPLSRRGYFRLDNTFESFELICKEKNWVTNW